MYLKTWNQLPLIFRDQKHIESYESCLPALKWILLRTVNNTSQPKVSEKIPTGVTSRSQGLPLYDSATCFHILRIF